MSRLVQALSNKRGATSLIFAAAGVTVLGMVGMGTELGAWYLIKRHAQNAADAAASSGALAIAFDNSISANNCSATGTTPEIAAARAAATQNGFTSGGAVTVTAHYPPTSGAFSNSCQAVEAIVRDVMTPTFVRAFVGSTSVVIQARAVAVVKNPGVDCVLSLKQDLGIKGSTQLAAQGCVLASNATDATAINVQDAGATVTAGSFYSAGGCANCGSLPAATYQLPAADPFRSAQSVTLPTTQPAGCITDPAKLPTTPQTNPVYVCSKALTLTNGQTVNLVPGDYVLWEADLNLNGGATLTCSTCTGVGTSGVTLVLTGSTPTKIGSISINGGTTLNLRAPASSPYAGYRTGLDGLLIYVDKRAQAGTGTGNGVSVQINGGAGLVMQGGIYVPSVPVTFSGNMNAAGAVASTCLALVAMQVTFTGNSGFASSGCAGVTRLAAQQVVRIAE